MWSRQRQLTGWNDSAFRVVKEKRIIVQPREWGDPVRLAVCFFDSTQPNGLHAVKRDGKCWTGLYDHLLTTHPPPPSHGSFTTTTNYASLSCQQRSIPADTGLLCRRKAKAKMADGSCPASGHTPPSLPILNMRHLGVFFFCDGAGKAEEPDHTAGCVAHPRGSLIKINGLLNKWWGIISMLYELQRVWGFIGEGIFGAGGKGIISAWLKKNEKKKQGRRSIRLNSSLWWNIYIA